MFIPDELKKPNQFIDVAIPSNESYFTRIGEVSPTSNQYTGDEVASMSSDKIDQIAAYEAYAEQMSKESK